MNSTQETIAIHTKLYAELKRDLIQQGLFDPAYGFYASQVAILLPLYAMCAFALTLLPTHGWLEIAGIVVLAFVSAAVRTNIAYLAHDLGHRQVFHSNTLNDYGMDLVACIVGLSPSWWKDAHDGHHSFPNDEERDPNFQVSALAFSEAQFAAKTPIYKWISSKQHIWYWVGIWIEPVLMLYQSFKFLSRKGRHRNLEIAALVVYGVTHFGFLYLVLGLWGTILFTVVHQASLGFFLGSVFAPNHKGMRVILAGEDVSFLDSQTSTARNVRGVLANLFMGGLNLQTEHHLFPRMPRYRLKRAQPIVEAFCRKNGFSYYETSLWGSYKEIYHYFKTAGQGKPEVVEVKEVVAA